jgi:hypothetical protein
MLEKMIDDGIGPAEKFVIPNQTKKETLTQIFYY